MLSLPQDRENAQKYLAGAERAFQENGCELVQVIQTKCLAVGEAVAQTNDLLTANPDITGIYGMYDEAGIGAVQVLGERGLAGKVAVATADGSPTTVELVRDGSSTVCSSRRRSAKVSTPPSRCTTHSPARPRRRTSHC